MKRNDFGIPVYTYKKDPMPLHIKLLCALCGVLLGILVMLVFFAWVAYAEPAYTNSQIADAIFLTEGGNRAKVPYGILSVKVKDANEARQVCLNTIRNQRKRHASHTCNLTYLECLAKRYAPIKGATNDPTGLNKNWLSNIRYFLKKG